MSASGMSPIQTSIYALFTGDVTLMALIDGVFDDVPAGPENKYIVIGDMSEVPFRTFGPMNSARGHDNTFTIDVWTKDAVTGAGSKAAQLIIDRMTQLIEGAVLVVVGHTTVMALLKYTDVMRSLDARSNEMWRHGVARYDIIIQDV